MVEQFAAVFRDGAFYPALPCDLPNDSRVVLRLEQLQPGPQLEPSLEQRRESLRRAVERMRDNPLPADAPPITRDWIYDRS